MRRTLQGNYARKLQPWHLGFTPQVSMRFTYAIKRTAPQGTRPAKLLFRQIAHDKCSDRMHQLVDLILSLLNWTINFDFFSYEN